MKLINLIFKEDKVNQELKPTGLLSDSLLSSFLRRSIKYYEKIVEQNREQEFIKYLLKVLEEKKHINRKIKVLFLWTEIFKNTKYDLSDILLNKKIKIFTRIFQFKRQPRPTLDQSNVEEFCQTNILIPLYNYFMKLAVNEDLFKHCVQGKVPENDAFRRGTKIRYIWVFKLYNLINLIISLIHSCCSVLKKFPFFRALFEITMLLYKDALTMNNFIIEAIEEGCQDNYLFMPYFDMLQFYESLIQQKEINEQINEIYLSLKGIVIERTYTQQNLSTNEEDFPKDSVSFSKEKEYNRISIQEIMEPRIMKIEQQILQEIETHAVKVKLLSCSLKNPKKSYTQLETEYHEKLNTQEDRYMRTEENAPSKAFESVQEDFAERFRNLD